MVFTLNVCIFTASRRSLGQGNIFRSVCQEFCPQGGGYLLRGGAWSGEVSAPGGAWSRGVSGLGVSGLGGSGPRGMVPALGGVSGPRGACSRGVLVETPLPDEYCCGRYASYWNALLSRKQMQTLS